MSRPVTTGRCGTGKIFDVRLSRKFSASDAKNGERQSRFSAQTQVWYRRLNALNSEVNIPRTEQLLQNAANGDASALNQLLELHRDYLVRVVELRLDPKLRGRVDASDIVQETQIVATKRINDFLQRRPTSFKLWLRGEAIQQIGMQRRRHVDAAQRSIRRECSMSDASSLLLARRLIHGTPSKDVERKELAQSVRQLLDDLPEVDREILVLRYVEELNNAEAAELLEIDPAASRKRHGRALKRLTQLMIQSGLIAASEKS